MRDPSSIALPRLVTESLTADEQNLGWTAVPDAFAGGAVLSVDSDARAGTVSRCRAFRLPDPLFEPRFEEFSPF